MSLCLGMRMGPVDKNLKNPVGHFCMRSLRRFLIPACHILVHCQLSKVPGSDFSSRGKSALLQKCTSLHRFVSEKCIFVGLLPWQIVLF